MLCMVMGGCDVMGTSAFAIGKMVTVENIDIIQMHPSSAARHCNAHSAFGDGPIPSIPHGDVESFGEMHLKPDTTGWSQF